MYQPVVARFMSRDPLPADGTSLLHPMPYSAPYVYANNDPINASDPSGLLTVKATGQDLDKLTCAYKEAPYLQWDFLIDYVDPKTKKKGAPRNGVIVQKVHVACNYGMKCDYSDGNTQFIEYFEFWPVPKFADRSPLHPAYTDKASWAPGKTSWGYYVQTGEIKFYCFKGPDDPTKNPLAPMPEIVPLSAAHGQPPCQTTAGGIASTETEPVYWKTKPVDGPAKREFEINWLCCRCKGERKYVKADGSPKK